MRRLPGLLPPVRGALAGGGLARAVEQRRDEERAQALTETPPLDLDSPAWHEPPHAEIVNAATFALRRAVNAYPGRRRGRSRGARRAPRRRAGAGRRRPRRRRAAARRAARRCWRARDRPARSRSRGRAGGRCRGSCTRPAGGRCRCRSAATAPPTSTRSPPRPGRPRARSRCARPTTRRAGRSAPTTCAGSRDALPAGAWILLDAALADFEEPERRPRRRSTGELERAARRSARSPRRTRWPASAPATRSGPRARASCSGGSRPRSASPRPRRRG